MHTIWHVSSVICTACFQRAFQSCGIKHVPTAVVCSASRVLTVASPNPMACLGFSLPALGLVILHDVSGYCPRPPERPAASTSTATVKFNPFAAPHLYNLHERRSLCWWR